MEAIQFQRLTIPDPPTCTAATVEMKELSLVVKHNSRRPDIDVGRWPVGGSGNQPKPLFAFFLLRFFSFVTFAILISESKRKLSVDRCRVKKILPFLPIQPFLLSQSFNGAARLYLGRPSLPKTGFFGAANSRKYPSLVTKGF